MKFKIVVVAMLVCGIGFASVVSTVQKISGSMERVSNKLVSVKSSLNESNVSDYQKEVANFCFNEALLFIQGESRAEKELVELWLEILVLTKVLSERAMSDPLLPQILNRVIENKMLELQTKTVLYGIAEEVK